MFVVKLLIIKETNVYGRLKHLIIAQDKNVIIYLLLKVI